jgi:hypothetical protein
LAVGSPTAYLVTGGINFATWQVLRKRRLAHWGGEAQVTGFAPE